MPSGILLKEVKKLKIEDNHYTYRIETKDSQGALIDFVDIDTVEPLRCAYDVQDELNLETNEHIKRVEEIVLNATSEEFWYVDEARTSDTHLVCYFEEVQLMANADHPMVDTDRSIFGYGKINSNEHQNTNFICTHVLANGVSRVYMSINKEQLTYQVFNNETIKEYIASNPITIWYAIRYPVVIPRSMSKGHLLTLSGQTDISISSNGDCGLPLVKFNIGDTQYNMDVNPIHLSSTTEGTQIRNIVLEGNTPINYARGNGVNTTEATSNTRYDFAPFYDGQATIPNTVEGGYVSAKLYGDTMVNIAKPYGETPLLTATNESTLCDDLLGANEEGIVLADGEITEGRIVGNSVKTEKPTFKLGNLSETTGTVDTGATLDMCTEMMDVPSRTFSFYTGRRYTKIAYYDVNRNFISSQFEKNIGTVNATIPSNAKYVRYGVVVAGDTTEDQFTWKYEDGTDVYGVQSVVNPHIEIARSTELITTWKDGYALSHSNGSESTNASAMCFDFISVNEGDILYMNNVSHILYYNENKAFFSYLGVISANTDFTIPSGVSYIRGYKSKGEYPKIYIRELSSEATLPYTLNKLPNGVADYIDVVNKVHVQRVGRVVLDGSETGDWIKSAMNANNTQKDVLSRFFYNVKEYNGLKTSSSMLSDKLPYSEVAIDRSEIECVGHMGNAYFNIVIRKDRLATDDVEGFKTWLQSNPITILHELATPIYTPLTEEEIAQLPLSAYKDGYVMLSSDQLTPSFEFRMRASNRYQVDMLETGYYYLNAPTGNVKLGTASVDVQQMPCIVKVDNVGTGDSGYRLGFSGDTMYTDVTSIYGGYVILSNGKIDTGSSKNDSYTDFIKTEPKRTVSATTYIENLINGGYGVIIGEYDLNKSFIKATYTDEKTNIITTTDRTYYIRVSYRCGSSDNVKKIKIGLQPSITLAKLPSHRIPTSFTQGMKCATDFGYWEGIKVATGKQLYISETNKLDFAPIQLNRIEYNNTIVEDEFDIATGKLTKRIGKYTIDGNSNITTYSYTNDTALYKAYVINDILNLKSYSHVIGFIFNKGSKLPQNAIDEECWQTFTPRALYFRFRKDRYSYYGNGVDGVKAYFNANPTTIYYELEVPEISYVNLSSNQVETVANKTLLQSWRNGSTYLNPQIKPSHLTYPVPSLVGNRTYTVVHNRKNITGSTKPITLDLGGTQVELNDESGKTLVKTPSTLKHSSLIFIGGESTVDHVMVLDGDWTNKPIEYFENMKGHDTDAIITIIGDGQINDVAEQYLW